MNLSLKIATIVVINYNWYVTMQFLFTSEPIDICTKQCIVKTINKVNEETFCQNPYFVICIGMNERF